MSTVKVGRTDFPLWLKSVWQSHSGGVAQKGRSHHTCSGEQNSTGGDQWLSWGGVGEGLPKDRHTRAQEGSLQEHSGLHQCLTKPQLTFQLLCTFGNCSNLYPAEPVVGGRC